MQQSVNIKKESFLLFNVLGVYYVQWNIHGDIHRDIFKIYEGKILWFVQ